MRFKKDVGWVDEPEFDLKAAIRTLMFQEYGPFAFMSITFDVRRATDPEFELMEITDAPKETTRLTYTMEFNVDPKQYAEFRNALTKTLMKLGAICLHWNEMEYPSVSLQARMLIPNDLLDELKTDKPICTVMW